MFVNLFGSTCGVELYPKQTWICVHKLTEEENPFGSSWMLITIGMII